MEVFAVFAVLAGGIAGGLVLLRITVASPKPPSPLWEVVPVAVEADERQVEVVVAAATGGTIRLVGARPPVGVLSAFEGWRATSTPVLLRMDTGEEASLHGPDASIVGLVPRAEPAGAGLPCNTVERAGHAYLRVTTPHDRALHLVPRSDELGLDHGRPAVDVRNPQRSALALAAYDAAALLRPCWTPRTMCGQVWRAMAGHDAELDALTRSLPSRGDAGYVCGACATFAAQAAGSAT